MVNQLEMLYEGKAKKIYATDKEDMVIVHYKDDATAFNGEKSSNRKQGSIKQRNY